MQFPLHPNSPIKPLSPERASKRDRFKVGAAFTLPALSEIPNTDWQLAAVPVRDQSLRADTVDDMCGPHALCEVLETSEGVQLDPGFSQALIKEAQGNPNTWGADIETIGMTAVNVGALPLSRSPFPDRPRSFVSDIKNWPAIYKEYAAPHRQKVMLWVKGPYDHFDNIRATLWLLKNLPPGIRKSGVLTGSYWYGEWQHTPGGIIPKERMNSQPSGHATKFTGQKIVNGEPRLVDQNSYGEGVGDKGFHYFSRETVNREFKDFGAVIFVDLTDEELAALREQRQSHLQQMIAWLKSLLVKPDPAPAPAPSPIPEPPPAPVPSAKYLWDTKSHVRHSIRVICDEEGLTLAQKNLICAVIQGESGFDISIVHPNNDPRHTTDYGLCQFNDYWYRDSITPDQALHDPEKAVRLMIKQYRGGRLKDWVAYSSGAYRKYL
jgi:hypothetical protein